MASGSIIGMAKISPQEMVCHAPRLLETIPPSAYPSAHKMTAARRNRSPLCNVKLPPLCRREKPMADIAPNVVAIQKSAGG